MEFKFVDQEKYDQEIGILIEKNKKGAIKYYTAIIIFMILSIISFMTYTGYGGISILYMTLSLSGLIFALVGSWIHNSDVTMIKRVYKDYFKRPGYIKINEDFTIDCYREGKIVTHIECVENIKSDRRTREYVVYGKIKHNYYQSGSLEFRFPVFTKEVNKLLKYMKLNSNINNMKNFKNVTLKNIFSMEAKQRNKIFIKEIVNSRFLIPISIDVLGSSFWIEPIEDIKLGVLSESNHLFVYTDISEVKNVDTQTFFEIDFDTIVKMLPVTDEIGIMKRLDFCLVINPNSDNVKLTAKQMKELQKMNKREGE